MKLSESWTLYLMDKQTENYSKYTLEGYRIQLNLLIRYFGDVDLEALTLLDLKRYVSETGVGKKPSTIEHRIKFIKSLYRWATDEGYIEKNQAAKMKSPKMGKRVPKALPEEDIEMLREGCITPVEHAIVELMYSTGGRIGEIHRLNRNAFDWEERSVIVLGKGDKEREVYFTIKAAIWLKRYLKGRTDNNMALFVTERNYKDNGNQPRRLSIAQIRFIIKRIAVKSGITANVWPHRLRHSFATHLLNNGAPLEAIQSLMGHDKIETTKLYADLSGPRRKEYHRRYF